MIREIAIRILKIFNPGTIKIKHPFTGLPFYLDAYKHKGYWYRGKKVEHSTFDFFRSMINQNNVVIEVGAHIGFMTVFISRLIGENGKLFVFEPGVNNLSYLKKNIAQLTADNTVIIEKAVAQKSGTATFFLENITGQNNSLVHDHIGPNSHANLKNEKKKFTLEVETISLDDFFRERNLTKIDFIKIDIEAAEYEAFLGMKKLLQKFKPAILMEVTRHQKEIFEGLSNLGYIIFNEKRKILKGINFGGNIFAIHESDTKKLNAVK